MLNEVQSNAGELKRAYEYCRWVTRRHAKTFYFAAKFLPRRKQLPIYALYALCRHIDDEIDEAEVKSEGEAGQAVNRWKEKLSSVYGEAILEGEKGRKGKEEMSEPPASAGGFDANKNQPQMNLDERGSEIRNQKSKIKDQNLVLLAWSDLLKTCKIPQNLPLELMKGVLMDTHINRYETFEELYIYCYRVASTVGLMSSEIFGYEKPETLDYAEALGIAMQLTNILRDLKEDAAMNRIYLPQEDLRKFGVSTEQIFENKLDENFVGLMKFEIGRAREYYQKAERGIALLEKDARFPVLLASRIYGRILDEIEKQDYDVFKRRAHTTASQKIFFIPRIWREAGKL
jgi:15-cis-phytoene synthase